MHIFSKHTFHIIAALLFASVSLHGEKLTEIWNFSLKQKDLKSSEWQLNGNAKLTPDGIVTGSDLKGRKNSEAVLLKKVDIPRLEDKKLMRIEWEYTPLRIGKYGQDFRIENGPLVMEVMSRRPYLNIGSRASFNQSNYRRYKVTCDFFKNYVVSWKINGMEQLKEPAPAWKISSKPGKIVFSDFPDSVSRTLWHRVALYQIDEVDQLKINLLCLKQIQRQQQADFLVGINSSMDKIPLDSLKYKGKLDATVKASAAGGERTSFQLAVIPQNKGIKQLNIRVTDFLGKNGKRLPAKIISYHPVGYVKLVDSKITDSKYGEYWPDVIMPQKTLDVKKGLTQPYWFNIAVPANTPAGTYESIINISSNDNGGKSLKLQLKVRGFNLPRKNTLVMALAVNPGGLERCYNAEKSRKIFGRSDAAAHNKMYNMSVSGALEGKDFWRPLYDMLLSYRVNPASIYSDILAGGSDFRVVPSMNDMDYCYQRGLNAVCLMCLRKLPKEPKKRQEYFAKVKKHLKKWEKFAQKRNWPGFIWYIHAFDESEIHSDTPERRKRYDADISEASKFIKREFPWIKIETANPYVKRNAQCFDIWTPRPFRLDEYTKINSTFWMYVCCGPQKPYANFFIDYPGTDPRVIPLQLFLSKTQVTGFLYYLMNREIYPEQWAKVKLPFPFVPVKTRWLNTNGDGLLLYPGPDKKIYPSTRLACFRDGLEDYEALKLLRGLSAKLKKLPASAVRNKLLKRAAKILQASNGPVKSWTEYSTVPADYTAYRDQIDQLIEEILALTAISRTGE